VTKSPQGLGALKQNCFVSLRMAPTTTRPDSMLQFSMQPLEDTKHAAVAVAVAVALGVAGVGEGVGGDIDRTSAFQFPVFVARSVRKGISVFESAA
jgi:hypothetical protein